MERDHSKPWYDQAINYNRYYALNAPYQNVHIGCDPRDGMTKETADSYDAIVNVSSTKCALFEPSRPDQRTYWFPIVELGRWPLVYLLWLKEVMDYHYERGDKIYLHCHAGAYRSPHAAILWLESRGHALEEVAALANEGPGMFDSRIKHGNLPKLKGEVIRLMQERKEKFSIESLEIYGHNDLWGHEIVSGDTRKRRLLYHYFWPYYRSKWWIKGKVSLFKEWRRGCGYVREGVGIRYLYKRKRYFGPMENAEPVDNNKIAGTMAFVGGEWAKVREWDRSMSSYMWLPGYVMCDACGGFGKFSNKTPCLACDQTGTITMGKT